MPAPASASNAALPSAASLVFKIIVIGIGVILKEDLLEAKEISSAQFDIQMKPWDNRIFVFFT